jgi:hypothetical protein
MSTASCETPLEDSVLEDYWLGDLSPTEEEAAELHVLDCDGCSRRLRRVVDLAGGIRALARRGTLRVVVTGAFLERLAREGLRVREYRVAPGGRVACTVTPDDDLVIGRLAASLAGVERLDLALCDAEGREQQRLRDIPVNPTATEVVVTAPIEALRALPASVRSYRLIAVEADGERLLGEYTFAHTPSVRV